MYHYKYQHYKTSHYIIHTICALFVYAWCFTRIPNLYEIVDRTFRLMPFLEGVLTQLPYLYHVLLAILRNRFITSYCSCLMLVLRFLVFIEVRLWYDITLWHLHVLSTCNVICSKWFSFSYDVIAIIYWIIF